MLSGLAEQESLRLSIDLFKNKNPTLNKVIKTHSFAVISAIRSTPNLFLNNSIGAKEFTFMSLAQTVLILSYAWD